MSLDTLGSIAEEHAPPFLPAEAPYQRRKLKRYKETADGWVQGQTVIEPFDFDRDTWKALTNAVYNKLRQDDQLLKKTENVIMRDKLAERRKFQDIYSDYDRIEKKLEGRHSKVKRTPDRETPNIKVTRSAYNAPTRSEQAAIDADLAEDKFAAISRTNSVLDMTGFSKMPE